MKAKSEDSKRDCPGRRIGCPQALAVPNHGLELGIKPAD
ncbi:hypothetical protein SynBIOSE41_00984 [Synechococcus sp. BIOS-E4-1]|nr:hypothetical protein SynBIOSE41_00984 [Synechococcus sp. BIOS-E4-1]